MRRRELLAGLIGAPWWPPIVHAQQSMLVVGFLDGTSPAAFAYAMPAFRQGLNETGYF
jgi:hypothetical protein